MTLAELQQQLVKQKIDAYLVTRNNMFIGQDILPEENKLLELTGFSGSAGEMIVFPDRALLFVDGRYELQASQETDSQEVSVICSSDNLGSWMQQHLKEPLKIMYDPWCHSINQTDFWNRALKRHSFVEDKTGLLGSRLSSRQAEIFEHSIEFAGITMEEKISYLTDFMQKNQLDAFFISECDAVSWLLNLRSNLLPDTPIIRAFALVDKSGEVSLFTNDLKQIEVELARYQGKTVGLSYHTTPRRLQTVMKDHKIWMMNYTNPIQMWKAVKNPVELDGFKKAHLRDAVAVIRFLHWLEHNWEGQDELSVVAKLREFRAKGENFYSDSFPTIAAFGPHGAIVHYQPKAETNLKLESGSVLLLDSGAQYYDATTDITRTIAIGQPTSEQKDSFTQVLKAHIAPASAYFPEGTPGSVLDTLSRAKLWNFGKEYKHGTGHGVGCFLNVHEGPHNLSSRSQSIGLKAGMISSIEPGYYLENNYGIRIENLVYIKEVEQSLPTPMLQFEPLTLVPIDKCLINKYLLNKRETEWLNSYHRRVWSEISPLLEDKDTLRWLEAACSPL